jgi:hypothetical protein
MVMLQILDKFTLVPLVGRYANSAIDPLDRHLVAPKRTPDAKGSGESAGETKNLRVAFFSPLTIL